MLENTKNLISLFIECAIFNELVNKGVWIDYENNENTIEVFNKYNLVTDIKKALKIAHLNETIDNVDNNLLYELYVDIINEKENYFKYYYAFANLKCGEFDTIYSLDKDKLIQGTYNYINNVCCNENGESYNISIDDIIKDIQEIKREVKRNE